MTPEPQYPDFVQKRLMPRTEIQDCLGIGKPTFELWQRLGWLTVVNPGERIPRFDSRQVLDVLVRHRARNELRFPWYGSRVDCALAYAARGLVILPLWSVDPGGRCGCPLGEHCPCPGKHLHDRLLGGRRSATSHELIIMDWFAEDPAAGVALALAPNNLLAIEVDAGASIREIGLSRAATRRLWRTMLRTPHTVAQGDQCHFFFSTNSPANFEGQLSCGVRVVSNFARVPPRHNRTEVFDWCASPLTNLFTPASCIADVLAMTRRETAGDNDA